MKIINGKEVLEDGEHLTCSIMMMDNKPSAPVMHRPGFVQLSDAEKASRERLYRDHDEKLTERWKNPAHPADHSSTVQAIGKSKLNAYQRYQERVGNAWRHR